MEPLGIIYGNASGTRFDFAVSDPALRRLDYVATRHDGHEVLCQVDDVVRKGGLSFDDALGDATAPTGPSRPEDRLSASAQVVGFIDAQGRVQSPLTPFAAGSPVRRAPTELVTSVLGLQGGEDGAYIGRIKGTRIPVRLSMNVLAQKHVSVLAKTGAGKSYTVGVLLEEFLAAGVPLVILDPHGEYGSLRHANIDEKDAAAMADHKIRPRSFDKSVREYAIDTDLNPEAERLRLEGVNLEGHEIVDLLGGKITGGQVGLLYQAINEVKEHMPSYTLIDIMDAVQQNRSAAKWNVINALEALHGTGIFHIRGTPVAELVRPKQCTILNLKGVAPDIQEVAVTRVTGLLWEARKRGEVPPFILVCEEAHNFCPERGVGNAISGAVIRTVASEGRKFGMGLVIVSQRPAKIDKNVLSQCNTQFVLKVTNPNDLKAIVSSVEGITGKASDEVQRLPIGTALIAGGGLTQPVFVDVRPRLTRHGGHSVDVVGGQAATAITRPKLPRLPSGRGGQRGREGEPAPPARDDTNRRESVANISGPAAAAEAHRPAAPIVRAIQAAVAPRQGASPAPAVAPTPADARRIDAGPTAPSMPDPPPDRGPPARMRAPDVQRAGRPNGWAAGAPSATPGLAPSDHADVDATMAAETAWTGAPTPRRLAAAKPARQTHAAATAQPARADGLSIHDATSTPLGYRPARAPTVTHEAPTSTLPAPDAKPSAHDVAPPKWTKKDAGAIHRVASRVGIVSGQRPPADTIDFIQHLARQNGRNPDMRVGLYAEIARTVCHDDMPACIRCPLAQQCQHHQRLQTERKKNRNPIRRLWSR